jgi:CrcB protein
MRLLIITGFLGGFTTFSTFGYESLQLFTEGKWKLAISYILLSNVIGIILVFLGLNFVLKLKY